MSRPRSLRGAPAALAALLVLGACAGTPSPPAPSTEAVDAALHEAMLAAAGPERALAHAEAAARNTDDPALRRRLGAAYARAGRLDAAGALYDGLAARGEAEGANLLERALIAARRGDWRTAAEAASALPSGFASPRRARLEALLADRREDWAAADAAYARAAAEDPDPAAVHNNWGMSRMSRGDLAGAVAAFERALALDPDLFAARNNGAIARARLGDYRPPSSALGDAERAVLLNNMGLVALGRGDAATARRLLAEAVATHPRHYAAAADRLAALDDSAL